MKTIVVYIAKIPFYTNTLQLELFYTTQKYSLLLYSCKKLNKIIYTSKRNIVLNKMYEEYCLFYFIYSNIFIIVELN